MILKILLILLGVLLLLLCIPIRVTLRFREEFNARFTYLVFRYAYPPKKKKRTKEPTAGGKIKKDQKQGKKSSIGDIIKRKGLDGFITFMKDITGISGRAIGFVLRHSRVSFLKVEVVVGGEDAARTAIECGYYAAAVYPAVSFLSTLTTIRKPRVDIHPDYDAEETTAAFDMRGFVFPIIALLAVGAAFFRYIRLSVKRRIVEQRS